eukprot:TRINITY_DN7891_c0_g1_i3.p2 TRINITY_DN7891_c0_g1~~TRINITY_DN7891_c0_g1_i3.p2  ORF type:complete len:123 (+),score=12.04 TRINITY_DN7891_c0_g1_i3:20-388(+)
MAAARLSSLRSLARNVSRQHTIRPEAAPRISYALQACRYRADEALSAESASTTRLDNLGFAPEAEPQPKFKTHVAVSQHDETAKKFINCLMNDGRKQAATKVFEAVSVIQGHSTSAWFWKSI